MPPSNHSPYFEEVKELLFQELEKVARDDNDRLSFDVRPGVTFRGIELFMGNRIYQLDPKKIEHNKKAGRLHEYLTHAVQNLRGKTLNPFVPTCYTRSDVLREITFWLVRCLNKLDESGMDLLQAISKRVEAGADCKLTEAAKYSEILRQLEKELVKLMKGQQKTKRKPIPLAKSCL